MDDKTKELAALARFVVGVSANADRQIEQFAALIRQDENEACAKVCDEMAERLVDDGATGVDGAGYCAAEIRERMK